MESNTPLPKVHFRCPLSVRSAIQRGHKEAPLHGAQVERPGLEWSFGWTPEGTGVHNVYAGCSEVEHACVHACRH